MIQLVYSPKWFYGKDIIIDLISVFALLLIAFFSAKYYSLKKNKNHLLLAISFVLMGLSFLFKAITNFTIYSNMLQTKQLGLIMLTYTTLKSSNLLFFIGFLMYRVLMLLGLYLLYSIYHKQDKANLILIIYLIMISTYFSRSAYYIFHMTALILLYIITSEYLKNFKRNKLPTNKWLASSFALITISQAIFIFIKIHTLLYVIAELVQLMGYAGLLITFIKVLKDGKKKGKK